MAANDEIIVKFRADVAEANTKLSELESKVNSLSKTFEKGQTKINNSTTKTTASFNTLGHSVNQLTRELPAFTLSAQTGFLALSNNIPMLADQINILRQRNLELVKSGQSAIPIWKSLGSALLSWNTLISLGITLITVYGKEIGDWVSGLFKAEKQLSRTAEIQDKLNKVNEKAIENSLKEKTEMLILLGIAKDTTRNYDERKNAVDKLQKLYPTFLGNLSDEKILTGDVTNEVNKLTESLLKRARAEAAVAEIVENEKKIIQLSKQVKGVTELIKTEENRLALAKKAQELSQYNYRTQESTINASIKSQKDLDNSRKEAASIAAEIADLQAQNNELLKQGADGTAEFIKAENIRSKQRKVEKLEIKEIDDELEQVYITTQKIAEINQDFEFISEQDLANADALKKKWDDIAKLRSLAFNSSIDISSNLVEVANNLTETEIQRIEATKQSELDALDAKLKRGVINEEKYARDKMRIEKSNDDQIKELKAKQLNREKAVASFQAIIKGGLATLQAFLELGPIAGALTALSVASQVAAIQSEPIPQFEKGGIINGKRHLQGGVLIEAEGGEFINNRVSTMRYKEELESANNMTLDKLIHRKYVIPQLKRQEKQIVQSLTNNFNDTNLIASDVKNREILREIRDALRSQNSYKNIRFKNV